MSQAAQIRYDSRMAYKVGIKLNRKTDSDLIEALEATPNKQALIKDALRGYLKSGLIDTTADKLIAKGEQQ